MRRRLSLKSDTYPEGINVDAAGISVEVCTHYPGRSESLFHNVELRPSRGERKDSQKSAESIVGHSA